MLLSEKLAIAAHLHVLLRRKTGRVTDTEWMASNGEYAAEVVRFARRSATEDGHVELAEWADKLEQAMSATGASTPVAQRAQHPSPTLRSLLTSHAPVPRADEIPTDISRYVRGLR
jgi:hypothetical protein